jgi:hypothetical protein
MIMTRISGHDILLIIELQVEFFDTSQYIQHVGMYWMLVHPQYIPGPGDLLMIMIVHSIYCNMPVPFTDMQTRNISINLAK